MINLSVISILQIDKAFVRGISGGEFTATPDPIRNSLGGMCSEARSGNGPRLSRFIEGVFKERCVSPTEYF